MHIGWQSVTPMQQVLRLLALIVLSVFWGGCEGEKYVLVVTPGESSLIYIGEQVQQTAYIVRLSTGERLETDNFSWKSDNAEIAIVDSQGLVSAVGNGTTQITATASGITGQASVIVEQTPASVSIGPSPPNPELEKKGDKTPLDASAFDAGGALIPDAEFLWSSSDVAIVSVSETGLATFVAYSGEAEVSASLGELSDSVFFSVEIPGGCLRNVTSSWDLHTAREMAKLSEASSGGREPLLDCWDDKTAIVSPEEYECSEDILGGAQEEDTFLEIFRDKYSDDITISFRGSQEPEDALTDIQTSRVDWLQKDYQPGSDIPSSITTWPNSVHRGFFCAYQSVNTELRSKLKNLIDTEVVNRSSARVYFTGHSLGGALAVLASLDYADWLVDSLGYNRENIILYSLAAPRAITKEEGLLDVYTNSVSNSWQIVAQQDDVPHYLESRYTHTKNIVVLTSHINYIFNPPTVDQYDSARIDFGDGRRYENCTWLGGSVGPFEGRDEHEIPQYIKRLDNIRNPGIPNIRLSVDLGQMRMSWPGDLKGPCDRVAIYRGDPFNGGQIALGLNTLEWALQDPNSTQLTTVDKGPRYYIVYANGFSRIIRSVKYEPEVPRTLSLERSFTGYLRVVWSGVGDEGPNDFVAVYNARPTESNVNDHISTRNVFTDTDNEWTTLRRWSTEGRWVAYVTQESYRRGPAKILKSVQHNP